MHQLVLLARSELGFSKRRDASVKIMIVNIEYGGVRMGGILGDS